MGYLLDANILIAMLDPEHIHHGQCQEWFESTGHRHRHTCPTTENGAIRVLCGASYPGIRQRPDEAIERLESLLPLGKHQFIPDDLSMLDRTVFQRTHLRGSKQITDTYLLGLAVTLDATFATMDRRLDTNTVRNGKDHILLIG
jgi:toxin-antitoxin system PIN domain toxin